MIKNENIVKKILQNIDHLIETGKYIYEMSEKGRHDNLDKICNTMLEALHCMNETIKNMKQNSQLSTSADLQCESIIASLENIVIYSKSRSSKFSKKIQFEFIPLLKDMYLQMYFWECIYPDKEKMKMYYEKEMIELSSNNFIDEAENNNEYKYDLSIVVLAYNKLEYTKLCIESLFKYVPSSLNYELLLVNHGSSDGTKEYFESLSPTKQLDIFKNGGAGKTLFRIIEGKYVLTISNDVLVTENAITNMINCMESDDNIAWVVPTTPNVSNLQTIDGNYEDMSEMYKFASKNNISNPCLWEQRAKLCNPIDLKRSKVYFSSKGIGWGGCFHTLINHSFPDDTQSLLLRRNGHKMMLAKDAYCYHFGSVTLKGETKNYKDREGNKGENTFYLQGRKDFYNAFGIDPWGTGFCWDPVLFQYLPCNEKVHIDVLGINCGIGSNPLKIKENIKKNVHNLDVKVYNITDEKCYIEDLKGVSDKAEYVESIENIEAIINTKKYNYIIFEGKFETYRNLMEITKTILTKLQKNGFLSIKTSTNKAKNQIKKVSSNVIEVGDWIIINNS